MGKEVSNFSSTVKTPAPSVVGGELSSDFLWHSHEVKSPNVHTIKNSFTAIAFHVFGNILTLFDAFLQRLSTILLISLLSWSLAIGFSKYYFQVCLVIGVYLGS